MGADNAFDGLAAELVTDDIEPQGLSLLATNARVDNVPAVSILD